MSEFFLGFVLGFLTSLGLVLFLLLNRSWRHATFSGAPIPLVAILGMRLRGTPVPLLVDAHVSLTKRGHPSDWPGLEAFFLANRSRVRSAADLVGLVEAEAQDTERE